MEDSEVALIPKNDFYQLLYSNNEVSLKFIKLITNNLLEAEDKLIKLAYDSARKKVAEAILYLHKKHLPIAGEEDGILPFTVKTFLPLQAFHQNL